MTLAVARGAKSSAVSGQKRARYVEPMPRSCIFCGGQPTENEHVWPEWLKRFAGNLPASTHQRTLEHEGQEALVNEFPLPPFDLQANIVCKKCNGGWMSRLEDDAKDLLLPMLRVHGRDLHQGGQKTLATWALMKAMAFEYTNPANARAIPQIHRDAVRADLQPPACVRIWLAAYDATHPGRYFNSAMAIGDELTGRPEERNVYTSTFTLGPVVFQVFGTTHDEVWDANINFKLPGVIHQIWPYENSITWNPLLNFDNRGLEDFATRIYDELLRITRQGT